MNVLHVWNKLFCLTYGEHERVLGYRELAL